MCWWGFAYSLDAEYETDREKSMKYLISYDLTGPDKDYPAVWKEFESLKAKRVLDSVWIVSLSDCHDASAGAALLLNRLRAVFDGDDGFVIVQVTPAACGANLFAPIH